MGNPIHLIGERCSESVGDPNNNLIYKDSRWKISGLIKSAKSNVLNETTKSVKEVNNEDVSCQHYANKISKLRVTGRAKKSTTNKKQGIFFKFIYKIS